MRVIIGGAYSGKRQFVRECHSNAIWISAYENEKFDLFEMQIKDLKTNVVVLEGFEKWLARDLVTLSNQEVREKYKALLQAWKTIEIKHNKEFHLIFLEMGKGIVPVEHEQRRLRDVMGWIQQDAIKVCDEAHYIWHGIAKQMFEKKERGGLY